jgi:hypothetical protein
MTRQQEIASYLIARDEGGDEHQMTWAKKFVAENSDAAHEGDCPHIENPAPFTCSRCVVDQAMRDALNIIQIWERPVSTPERGER